MFVFYSHGTVTLLCAVPFVRAEPGYYEDGAFGVRIENVVLVKDVDSKYNFGGKRYLTMEPVTMVTSARFLAESAYYVYIHHSIYRLLFRQR